MLVADIGIWAIVLREAPSCSAAASNTELISKASVVLRTELKSSGGTLLLGVEMLY